MLYTFLTPVYYQLDQNSLNEAIKNYLKLHRDLSIHQLIVQDNERRYRAMVKYFQEEKKLKAGIKVYQYHNL